MAGVFNADDVTEAQLFPSSVASSVPSGIPSLSAFGTGPGSALALARFSRSADLAALNETGFAQLIVPFVMLARPGQSQPWSVRYGFWALFRLFAYSLSALSGDQNIKRSCFGSFCCLCFCLFAYSVLVLLSHGLQLLVFVIIFLAYR